MPGNRRSHKVGDTKAQQDQRDTLHAHLTNRFQERTQVGKEGKVAAEDQDGRQHAADHPRTTQHAEQRSKTAAALRFHGGQHPQLPQQRQHARQNAENKHVAPANQAAEIAAQRRRDHRGNRYAGEDHRQRLRHFIGRNQTHRRGRRHRPESPDGNP